MTRYDIDSIDNRDPERIAKLCELLDGPLQRYFHFRLRGSERVPRGAALYVGNHSGGMLTPDSFLVFGALFRECGIDALPYGLGHEVAISLPIIHEIIVPLGAVRAGHEAAHRVFQRGDKVMVYPGGDVDNQRPYRHRNRVVFGGRKGYIRLALRERVPIVPIVTAGGHATFMIIDDMRWLAKLTHVDRILRTNVWPLTLSAPWGLTLGPLPVYWPMPTHILTEIVDPIRFDRDGPEAAEDDEYVAQCARHVESTMQATLERLARERTRRKRG
jgi:1-acyl-sn-glycerol-3-phosphate acyltransferase